MILCQTEFDNPHHERDVYGHIPIPNDRPDHKLSIRKNKDKDCYEGYRYYYPGFITGNHGKTEILVSSKDLKFIVEVTNAEAKKYWNSRAQQDQVCNHNDVKAKHCHFFANVEVKTVRTKIKDGFSAIF